TAWSRCYSVTAVCVVLLCVLLLTAVTVLWIKYNNLNTENNKLQTSYNNLTKERDQLKMERDAHLRRIYDLDKVRCFHSGLYFVYNEKKNWTESRQDCMEKGGDLVIINNQEEQNFITEQLKGGHAWIGLSDRDTEGEWKWVNGTLLTSG
ncbi:antigen like protein, partial [Clarias magur]